MGTWLGGGRVAAAGLVGDWEGDELLGTGNDSLLLLAFLVLVLILESLC